MNHAKAPNRPSTLPLQPFPKSKRPLSVLFALWLCSAPMAAQSPPQTESLSSLERATAMAEELLREQRDPLAVALERVEDTRMAALETEARSSRLAPSGDDGEKASSPKPSAELEAHVGAVAALARTPDPRTLPALTQAASHAEPAVRYAAMTALREGPSAGRESSAALLAARSLVLGDSHPGVRRQAFEAYCRWGDQDDVLALSQSLGSVPGPVRDLAVREWLRIERERSAR